MGTPVPRHVVLCVTGGVAAYKSAYLARRLIERGARVRVVMTRSATSFIGPQTFAAITGQQPVIDVFGDDDPSPHTNLARWADAVVVAPATASTLSRMATGQSSDAVSLTVLASWGRPIIVAPAMHTEMWENPATERNMATLAGDGVVVVGPASGELAGGDTGAGRMVEPEDIVATLEATLLVNADRSGRDLAGWKILVSAGGTREAIDPVRYIGNRSSGKMGNAIAVAAARRGAEVTLVTTAADPTEPGVDIVAVETADEMAAAVWEVAPTVDVAVLAAAVADFKPSGSADSKLRRADGPPIVELTPTPDILAGVATMDPRPYLVGFAAETGSLDEAVAKAKRKGVDLLVGNDVSKSGSGFGSVTNEVTIITPDGATDPWPLMDKTAVAERLWDDIRERRSDTPPGDRR